MVADFRSDGISGSLTRLTDGSSYLIAESNMTVISQSQGPLTIGLVNDLAFTGSQTFTHDDLETTPDTAIELTNTTTSSAGTTEQHSPALVWTGTAWDGNSSVSRTAQARMYVDAVTGNDVAEQLVLDVQLDAGGWKRVFILGNALGLGIPTLSFSPELGGALAFIGCDTPTTTRKGLNLSLAAGAAFGTDQAGGDFLARPGTPTGTGANGIGKLRTQDDGDVFSWSGTSGARTLAFFGVSRVEQQSTTGTTSGFTAGAGTGVNDDSTFDGGLGGSAYTIGDIVLAIKNYGLLAT